MGMLDNLLQRIRRIIPKPVFNFVNRPYHWTLAFLAAIWYRFPSRQIKVIGVTGTKGKSSTVELINAMLEGAGYTTAVSNTIRFKIGDHSEPNLFKMSMPGRFSVQKRIRQAVNEKCQFFILEMTSQGALLHRHKFIDLDTFVFTNISPEHIESHGSYENYRNAKVSIARTLKDSVKNDRTLVVNTDDPDASYFLECAADHKFAYSLRDAEPYQVKNDGLEFTWHGKKVTSPLSGLFNIYNILAAATTAHCLGVSDQVIIEAVRTFSSIPGRVQKIEAGQDFPVVVDYAHTADSLEKFYQVFRTTRNICVLGGTGGGRDTGKRARMGAIADQYCSEIILTDEDPYDEDPRKIVNDVAAGIKSKKPTIIMDRRLAIREAIARAKPGDAILITGKGTDPYIMGKNGTKTPWSDAKIAEEEIRKIIGTN
jgi:UDP-N-acetylmuramoyl-L-alanyl-D-glutamate--2,6-diaminopimelate ligase